MSARPHDLAFFGPSLVSAYWNGAATYYRGLLRALAARGHRITFYEPDALDRQRFRDLDDPPWARVVVYPGADLEGPLAALAESARASVVIKASGVGVFDALLEAKVLEQRRPDQSVVFWDVDAPATIAHLGRHPSDPLRGLLPRFDLVLTRGGGDPVARAYRALGAQRCAPIHEALDPERHGESVLDPRFWAHLSLIADRIPDRERRVESFFFAAARALPDRRFVLGGSGWAGQALPANVRWVGHVGAADHDAFNAGARAVLHLARDRRGTVGHGAATRIFESAGGGACVITDPWEGLEGLLAPGREILVARDGAQVAAHVATLGPDRARSIGQAGRKRVLAEHTYAIRAAEVEGLLEGR